MKTKNKIGLTAGVAGLAIATAITVSVLMQGTTWYVRSDGGTVVQCTGQTNAAYPGSGTGQACAFSSPQSAFDSAALGDTIQLRQGDAFFTGCAGCAFVLRPKAGGTNTDADYITVRTSAFASLPAGRVDASNANLMSKIVAQGSGGAIITTQDNVRYWKFVGIEITNSSSGTEAEHVGTLVDLGQSGLAPRNFWFDRCYVHPQEDGTLNYFRTVTRGFGINGVDGFKLTNSRVSGFIGRYSFNHNDLIDSEAFSTAAVGSNYLVDNNFLQAYFNTFFLGGGSSAPTNFGATVQASPAPTLTSCALSNVTSLSVGDYISFPQPGGARNANGRITNISGLIVTYTTLDLWNETTEQHVPASAPIVGSSARWGPNSNSPIIHIKITHNTFGLDTAYCQWEYDQTGGVRMPKGFWEIKWVDDLLMEGNIFDGWPSWLAINAVNQTGNSPWLTVRNVTIRYNWIREFAIGGLNFAFGNPNGTAAWHTTQQGSNIVVTQNLFTNKTIFPISLGGWGPRVMGLGWGANGFTLSHNTVYNHALETVATWAASGPTTNFVFIDNIFYHNQYGIGCSYAGQTFADCWPEWADNKNVVINATGNPNNAVQAQFPNSFVANNTANPVSWVAPVGNTAIADWALTVNSPYHNTASDGTDPGPNIPVLISTIAGGNPSPTPTPSPTATPTPTPSPTPTPTPSPTPTPLPSPTPKTKLHGKDHTKGKVVFR